MRCQGWIGSTLCICDWGSPIFRRGCSAALPRKLSFHLERFAQGANTVRQLSEALLAINNTCSRRVNFVDLRFLHQSDRLAGGGRGIKCDAFPAHSYEKFRLRSVRPRYRAIGDERQEQNAAKRQSRHPSADSEHSARRDARAAA